METAPSSGLRALLQNTGNMPAFYFEEEMYSKTVDLTPVEKVHHFSGYMFKDLFNVISNQSLIFIYFL